MGAVGLFMSRCITFQVGMFLFAAVRKSVGLGGVKSVGRLVCLPALLALCCLMMLFSCKHCSPTATGRRSHWTRVHRSSSASLLFLLSFCETVCSKASRLDTEMSGRRNSGDLCTERAVSLIFNELFVVCSLVRHINLDSLFFSKTYFC